MVDFGTVKISGFGEPQQFESILQNIVYTNQRLAPTPGVRTVKILPMVGPTTLPTISSEVNVEKNDKPKISIRGCKDIAITEKKLKEVGTRLCQSLVIDYIGCEGSSDVTPVDKVRYLDSAVVKIDPPLNSNENLAFPRGSDGESILTESAGFSVKTSPSQLVIRGVAHYSAYVELLRGLTYLNLAPESKTRHDFTVSLASSLGCSPTYFGLVAALVKSKR